MFDYTDNAEFEHKGYSFKARIEADEYHGAPWENEDGHGPVSEWTSRDKAPGEMVLHSDRGSKRFYDFKAAVRQAREEGWDCAPFVPGTRGQRAHRAALADFKRLQAWCNDQWHYVGVMVSLLDEEGEEVQTESLWGIESDAGTYLEEVARELAEQCL